MSVRAWIVGGATTAIAAASAGAVEASHAADRPFVVKGIDPEVKAQVEALLTGGMKVGACQTTMRRQGLKPEDLVEGLTPVPSGVVRVMELEEKGYAYIRP